MEVVLLVFRLPPKTPNLTVSKFCQRFYGQSVSSWGGKYRYRRRGLLDDVPHRKLLRGVVIVRRTDLPPLVAMLREFRGSVEVRTIKPTEEDLAILRGTPP